MNIDDAVKVLNEHKHRDYSNWTVAGAGVLGYTFGDCLSGFEAIAVAEKLVRDIEQIPNGGHGATPR